MKYQLLLSQLKSLLEDEKNFMPNIANTSALIYDGMEGLNWAGFYFVQGNELVLSAFQGKVACIRIPVGKGVCGTAVRDDTTLVVEDVHCFEGHIACDGNSRSEIVVPLHYNGKVIGVLDVDSPLLARFGAEEKLFFEQVAEFLESNCDWSKLIV